MPAISSVDRVFTLIELATSLRVAPSTTAGFLYY